MDKTFDANANLERILCNHTSLHCAWFKPKQVLVFLTDGDWRENNVPADGAAEDLQHVTDT